MLKHTQTLKTAKTSVYKSTFMHQHWRLSWQLERLTNGLDGLPRIQYVQRMSARMKTTLKPGTSNPSASCSNGPNLNMASEELIRGSIVA